MFEVYVCAFTQFGARLFTARSLRKRVGEKQLGSATNPQAPVLSENLLLERVPRKRQGRADT